MGELTGEIASSPRVLGPGIGAGVLILNGVPGVYEVKYAAAEGGERLHVGKASDLRMRIRQGLVEGKALHSAGKRIRAEEDVSLLVDPVGCHGQTRSRRGGATPPVRVAHGGLPRYIVRIHQDR